ncbi:FKBP-type peptidyl-prolyl cis-trans isomerase [Dictyobacter kobayashii]|uniref:Peptidyl-prolyl cis-trans isomerase n=1 Tax=Dictyobacter kobayashii TaxID=2014872 RepID=A0A402ABW8_9CHLR|nr:FKBP-type peptidyl-prolyl cis-trans isomerase [Dictyobacter kobayashii]GCE16590.1 hypothetical protein KDK_03900 [Dictyobacter kobayashii]
MTQTTKNQNSPVERSGRPGQRQRERELRKQRRARRRQLLFSGIVALLILIAALTWAIISARQSSEQAALADTHATATANAAVAQSTQAANAANAKATADVQSLIKANPKGLDTPPEVTAPLQKTATGVQYQIIKAGDGGTVQSGSTVAFEYTGWIQGTNKKFDSSYDHGGQPFAVTLGQGQVIKGWEDGVNGMKIGESRRLIIPASLGYGSSAQKDQSGKVIIPANATLIFDVTAVAFTQPPQQNAQPTN